MPAVAETLVQVIGNLRSAVACWSTKLLAHNGQDKVTLWADWAIAREGGGFTASVPFTKVAGNTEALASSISRRIGWSVSASVVPPVADAAAARFTFTISFVP